MQIALAWTTLAALVSLLVNAQPQQTKHHHATELRVFHRIFDPLGELIPPYTERGTLQLPAHSAPSLRTWPAAAEDLSAWAKTYADRPSALYQIALEREGDVREEEWDVSTVKACHLSLASADALTLHATVEKQPFALDYYLSPVPQDGSCPPPSSSLHPPPPQIPFFSSERNTSISLRVPRTPPHPSLRAPPVLTTAGQPAQPEPEKSFIQKYWMYLVAAMFVFLLAGGAPEEDDPRARGAPPAPGGK